MREIKFRGKDQSGIMYHDWMYGSLDATSNEEFPEIYCKDRFGNTMHISVDTHTIGQYTGQKDKNGKEIYEGDIVYFTDKDYCLKVEWVEYGWALSDEAATVSLTETLAKQCTVLGNVYDNPELIGE